MTLLHDVRYAIRLLRREPGYALVAVLTMALGIGAATTLFSVTYGVLMKPLPWPDPDRVVRLTEMRKGQQGRIRGTITNGAYLAWRERASTAEAIGAYSIVPGAMTLSRGSGEPVRVQVGRATASLFEALGVRPIRGRVFAEADTPSGFRRGTPPDPAVIVLSYSLWQEWFGGRDDAVGSVVRADEMPVAIAGVMPREFTFPDRDTRAWLPMTIGSVMTDAGYQRLMIFGALARLKPGVSPQQAAAEGTVRARSAPDPGFTAVAMFGSTAPPEMAVTSAADAMTADVRPALQILLAAVALLLATATANVAGLQLARATVRRREIAVRVAIGAGRARIVRQLVVESGVLAAAGAAAGMALVVALHRALPALLPSDFPRVADIAIDPHVLAFALAIVAAASVVCGLLPAAQLARVDVAGALADDNAASAAGAWRSHTARWRAGVMAAQIAVACVLLVGAALLARSFVALMRADRGYDPDHVLTARVDLPRRYDGPARAAFADRVLERIRSSPRVVHAAAGNALPFVSGGGNVGFKMPSPSNPSVMLQVQTLTRIVSPEYFQSLRLRVTAGRLLSDADTLTARPVIVVNRSFARRYLGPSPVGTRVPLAFGEGRPDCDVVGVVDDMRQGDVTDPPAPEAFASYHQMPARLLNAPLVFVVRTDDDPTLHAVALRTAVREQDPAAAVDSMVTLDERVMTSLAKPRLYAALLTGFAIAALAIAGVGLFGVLSYAVAQRSREIGVRTALGAQRGDVIALVLRQAMPVAVAGVAAGLLGSFVLTAYLAAFLYGVAAHDPATFVAAGASVIVVAGIACVVPARRAAAVDPVVVLKG